MIWEYLDVGCFERLGGGSVDLESGSITLSCRLTIIYNLSTKVSELASCISKLPDLVISLLSNNWNKISSAGI